MIKQDIPQQRRLLNPRIPLKSSQVKRVLTRYFTKNLIRRLVTEVITAMVDE
jgi:hypothetical protein